MPNTCKTFGCKNNCWGGGFCKYHQYERRRLGGDLYVSKPRSPKSGTKIPKESKTRKKDHIHYAQHCKELEKETRAENNGKIYCFFTGGEITERISWHHTNKRTGEFYLDKRWLVPSFNKYHIMYHQTPVEILSKETWYYTVFLKNLGELSNELLLKEKKKFDKSGVLFQDEDEEFN